MRLNDLLALSHVSRWSTVRHHHPQSVADHTFRTLVIYVELCERLGEAVTVAGLTAVMCHDGAEAWTGDIPGNFKRKAVENVPGFLGIEQVALDWKIPHVEPCAEVLIYIADKIEAYTYIRMQGQGAHAERVQQRIWVSLTDYASGISDVMGITVRGIVRDILNEVDRD